MFDGFLADANIVGRNTLVRQRGKHEGKESVPHLLQVATGHKLAFSYSALALRLQTFIQAPHVASIDTSGLSSAAAGDVAAGMRAEQAICVYIYTQSLCRMPRSLTQAYFAIGYDTRAETQEPENYCMLLCKAVPKCSGSSYKLTNTG